MIGNDAIGLGANVFAAGSQLYGGISYYDLRPKLWNMGLPIEALSPVLSDSFPR